MTTPARTLVQLINSTGAETDSGPLAVGDELDTNVDTLNLFLNLTALVGTTPTLDIRVEWSWDDGATWFDSGLAFAQASGPTQDHITAPVIAPVYRLVYTWGGTITDADLTIHEFTR